MKDRYIIIGIVLILLVCCAGIYWQFEQNAKFQKSIGIYHKISVPFKGNISFYEERGGWVAAVYRIQYEAKAPVRIVLISDEDEIRFDHTFENETVDVYVPCLAVQNNDVYIVHNTTYETAPVGPITAT